MYRIRKPVVVVKCAVSPLARATCGMSTRTPFSSKKKGRSTSGILSSGGGAGGGELVGRPK